MKKHITKSNIMFLIMGIIIGSIGIVIADTIHSNEVLYDNSNSSSSATDVQEALNDVYNTLDKVGSGYSLIAHATDNLSTELVAGLYRYQGVQDANNNVNNYICFGTTNKNTCVNDTDKYMYRIIGITSNGQMKLIKKEALNTAYIWNSSSGVDWAHSELYAGLNGSYFLNDTTYFPNDNWKNRIALTDWHYACFKVANADIDAATMYNREISSETVNAKIGLMYIHDYEYSLIGGNNCGHYGVPSTCKKGWIHLSNNDTSAPDRNYEKTITRQDCCNTYTIYDSGEVYLQYSGLTSYHSVRPVFFLNSSETIASGSGTITDPYILS